jgi:hypothetical protein
MMKHQRDGAAVPQEKLHRFLQMLMVIFFAKGDMQPQIILPETEAVPDESVATKKVRRRFVCDLQQLTSCTG